jgi:hypothetical protein
MSNFKYSANINGSIENKKRFVQDLELRGYKWHKDSLDFEYDLCVNSIGVSMPNGYYRSGRVPAKRDYTFYIDTEQEYNTALAILSMKGDELFNAGELVQILAAGGWGYNSCNNGCIGIVLETNQKGLDSFNCKGSTQNVVFKTLNPRVKDSYTDKADAPNLAYDKPVFRKLTSQEVINFYKTSSMQEKKLIGYKIIKQYPGLHSKFVGETVLSPLYKLSDGTYVAGQVFEKESKYYSEDLIKEFFEPVYEDPKPVSTKYTLESRYILNIFKDGTVEFRDGNFSIAELKERFGKYLGVEDIRKFKDWVVVSEEFKIRIHCPGHYSSGITVTQKDLKGIVSTFEELNK